MPSRIRASLVALLLALAAAPQARDAAAAIPNFRGTGHAASLVFNGRHSQANSAESVQLIEFYEETPAPTVRVRDGGPAATSFATHDAQVLTTNHDGTMPYFTTAAPSPTPNNVLLIVADDYGVDVASWYPASANRRSTNAPPRQPTLTALAGRGVIFSAMWTSPECLPSRVNMMTGRYGFRHGVGKITNAKHPSAVLQTGETTIAEALASDAGKNYLTAHVGKWHMGTSGYRDAIIHGFERQYAAAAAAGAANLGWGGGVPQLSMWRSWRRATAVQGASGQTVTDMTSYRTTQQVTDVIEAVGLAEGTTPKRPWFAYLALNTPHTAYHKPPASLISNEDTLNEYGGETKVDPWYDAMVESMDTEIGRLMTEVDLTRTTVIFIGDNGSTKKDIRSPYQATKSKSTVYEGGVRVPILVVGADVVGSGIAGAPRVIEAPVNSVDLFPTILELAGITVGSAVPVGTMIDGVTLVPYLQGSAHPVPRAYAYAERFQYTWNDRPERVIRDARWKLMDDQCNASDCPDSNDGTGVRLFDLQNDSLENGNLNNDSMTAEQQAAFNELQAAMAALLATR